MTNSDSENSEPSVPGGTSEAARQAALPFVAAAADPGDQPQAAAMESQPAGESGHMGSNVLAAQRGDSPLGYADVEEGIPHLPPYSRSLLKIAVPVMVTLAEARQPLQNVLDMGPGSIIHFNKPCGDSLSLEVAGRKIAVGDAVKVGDKFGLWVTSMILPEERFWVINNRAQTERAK